ncbi:hypothetical protein V8E52_011429 [Russula decolorans]
MSNLCLGVLFWVYYFQDVTNAEKQMDASHDPTVPTEAYWIIMKVWLALTGLYIGYRALRSFLTAALTGGDFKVWMSLSAAFFYISAAAASLLIVLRMYVFTTTPRNDNWIFGAH